MRDFGLLILFALALSATAIWDVTQRWAEAPDQEGAWRVEWASFEGGYGIDLFETVSKDYMDEHEGRTVHFWGNPRLDIQLQLRLLAKEAPDAIAPAWRMDPVMLIKKGLVQPLDEILFDKQWPGDDKPFRDYFRQDMLKWLQFQGPDGKRRTYALPIDSNTSVIYYHKDLFRKHGWEAPETWEQFMELCQSIKAAKLDADDGTAIVPIVVAGRFNYQGAIFNDLLARYGGMQLYLDCYQLRPGAWQRPGVKSAAATFLQLFEQDVFQPGALGMSHTDAQREFFMRHGAMIPEGAALVSEAKKLVEELAEQGKTFELGVFTTPTVAGGKGRAGVVLGKTSLFWFIPTYAKNPEGAAELLHEMCKPKYLVEQWALPRQMMTSLADIGDVELAPTSAAVARIFDEAPALMPRGQGRFYPGWSRLVSGLVLKLSDGTLDPDAFCDAAEAAAQRIRHEQGDPNGWDDMKKVGMQGAHW
jgi:N-acetylglucosamine transport system substrate-binding protein